MDPDLELVKQCQSKDPAVLELAFIRLYKKYGERAYNISFRILGNAEDALDVTQDAFLSLFRKIDQFRKNSRFYTWFYRIVVNLSIDKKRKLSSEKYFSESDREGLLEEVKDEKSVTTDTIVNSDFLEKKIQAALLKLTPTLRLVTVLRYIEALSYAEIAETLDCSIGTVKSRLNRAHRMLETLLRPMIDMVREEPKL